MPTPGPNGEHTTAPIANIENQTQERARYREIKAVALDDKEIKSLKEKADAATSDEDQRAASKAYYKALFNKMRTLDGSLSDYIDHMEKATYRRLDGGNSPQ